MDEKDFTNTHTELLANIRELEHTLDLVLDHARELSRLMSPANNHARNLQHRAASCLALYSKNLAVQAVDTYVTYQSATTGTFPRAFISQTITRLISLIRVK